MHNKNQNNMWDVIQRLSRPNYSAHAGSYGPIEELCLCWPFRLDTPCTWNYYSCNLSSRRDDLKLSCLLTQGLIPLESIANLNDTIYLITLVFYPAYARGVRRILQISRGLIIIAFEFITRNFVPHQYLRNAPVSLFRKRLISILAPPSVA